MMKLFGRSILVVIVLAAPIGCPGGSRPAGPTSATKPATAPAAVGMRDWPMFRGDRSLRGVAEGELPDSLKLFWRARTGGAVGSSAAIVAGKVFVGSDDGHVYCLELKTGRKLWAFDAGDVVEASPLVLAGVVYVGSGNGFLHAIDASTGREKWKYEAGDRILGAANWVAAPRGKGRQILVGSYDNKLHCVDAASGQGLWTYETDSYVNGAPAVAAGRAVFGGCDAKIYVISAGAGTKLAAIDTDAYIAASPALLGLRAYIGHYGAEFLCVDVATAEVLWRYRGRGEPFFSSPAVGPGRVIVGSRDKRLHCIRRSDGRGLWTFLTRGAVDSSPVICGGKVVFGSNDGRVYVVTLAEGKKVWSYDTGDAVSASPAVAAGMIVIGSENGFVYAFGPAGGALARPATIELRAAEVKGP